MLFFLWITSICFIIPLDPSEKNHGDLASAGSKKSIEKAANFYLEGRLSEAIVLYGPILKNETIIRAPALKEIVLSLVAHELVHKYIHYFKESVLAKIDTKLMVNGSMTNLQDPDKLAELAKKYTPTFSLWSLICLYIGLIGIYIATLLSFNKKIDKVARILITIFVLIHSVYILHIFLFITNVQYSFPHTYLMSGPFSFLFGPLLYFYFKRITQQYQVAIRDIIHLVPTVLMIIYLMPKYAMSSNEKLSILLDQAAGYTSENSIGFIVVVSLKIISFVVYGLLIRNVYLKGKRKNKRSAENELWQRNVYRLYFLYIIFYSLYGLLGLTNHSYSLLFNLQIIFMALMVLYIGYSANMQPSVFNGLCSFDNPLFFKYAKSGLTRSLSKELMENLIKLFDVEKIYKENDISLEMVAQRLNTSRHGASQVINEHFDMNFHELVNKYRIREAKSILCSDYQKNLNIIDVAYEVGYNNKVTFNKAFKKDTQLTPSQYQKKVIKA